MKKLIVQKYGGATLADPEKIKQVAARIHSEFQAGHQVVVIVSAMGKTTNQLIELATKISPRPQRRELDMLLTTGERISMSLVSMALNDLGCKAISFTGSQAGILTDDSHFNANIIDVKAFRVTEALEQGKAVVLAGFQGVSPTTKEITTLGRGGSDTTAVAMAAYLKADHCEILKDVPAVFTADPNLIPEAKILNELTYDQLCEMTFWGAKVLHYRSVELAKQKNVPLYIGPAAEKNSQGTWVRKDVGPAVTKNSNKILAVNSFERVLNITSTYSQKKEALEQFQKFLNSHEIADPQFLEVDESIGGTHFLIAGPQEILSAIIVELKSSQDFKASSESLCSVTATYEQPIETATSSSGHLIKQLQDIGCSPHKMISSMMSYTFILDQSQREEALKKLHLQLLN